MLFLSRREAGFVAILIGLLPLRDLVLERGNAIRVTPRVGLVDLTGARATASQKRHTENEEDGHMSFASYHLT